MNFRRWVVFTFLIHVLVVAVDKGGGLVLYLLTANAADQHGKSGIVASMPFIVMAIANLGLATSLVYFLRKGVYTAQQAAETTATVALVWGSFVALLALVMALWVVPWINPLWQVDPWLVVPTCAAVPLLLVSSYANSIQLATERVRAYNLVHLAASIAFLPAFFGVYFLLGADVEGGDVPMAMAWGRLASTFLVTLLVVWMVREVVRPRLGLHRAFLRDGLVFGWKANLVSTLTYVNHRIDLFVLGLLYVPCLADAAAVLGPGEPLREDLLRFARDVAPLPQSLADSFFLDSALLAKIVLAQVAFYSMAVTWAELVWHFPEAMRDLFFSKVAGSSHEKARELTPVLSRLGLALSLVAGTAIVLLIDPVMATVTWLAGKEGDPWFATWSEPVTQALLILSPGTVAFTVNKVLQADLSARNRLDVCVNAQILVLVVMLLLDWQWMPRYGAAGAAGASTIAYVAATAYSLWQYQRQTGVPWHHCVVVRWADFGYIRDIVTAVLHKLRRKS